MKLKQTLLVAILALGHLGWAEAKNERTVPFRDLMVRFNLFYLKGDTRPYSGRAVVVHDDDQLLMEFHFQKGRFHGPIRNYTREGILKGETQWERGQIVKITSFPADENADKGHLPIK